MSEISQKEKTENWAISFICRRERNKVQDETDNLTPSLGFCSSEVAREEGRRCHKGPRGFPRWWRTEIGPFVVGMVSQLTFEEVWKMPSAPCSEVPGLPQW